MADWRQHRGGPAEGQQREPEGRLPRKALELAVESGAAVLRADHPAPRGPSAEAGARRERRLRVRDPARSRHPTSNDRVDLVLLAEEGMLQTLGIILARFQNRRLAPDGTRLRTSTSSRCAAQQPLWGWIRRDAPLHRTPTGLRVRPPVRPDVVRQGGRPIGSATAARSSSGVPRSAGLCASSSRRTTIRR